MILRETKVIRCFLFAILTIDRLFDTFFDSYPVNDTPLIRIATFDTFFDTFFDSYPVNDRFLDTNRCN
jgi:hypothetical protein